MKALVIEPYTPPYVKEIEDTLEAMQKIVGGYIECFYPFEDDVCIICDEEGKINGSLPNRDVFSDNGNRIDRIYGTFFIIREGEEDFRSLTDKQIETYQKMFSLHKEKEKPTEKHKEENAR